MIVACICEYTKNHRIVYFKWVKYEVCELYLKKLCLFFFFLEHLSLVIFATGLHRVLEPESFSQDREPSSHQAAAPIPLTAPPTSLRVGPQMLSYGRGPSREPQPTSMGLS